MSKSAAVVLAFVGCMLFSIPMSAQFNGLLPNGNVYAGVSYAQLTDVINKQSYRGWNGSFEALPFTRFPRIGLVIDGSGFYRTGVKQYNIFGGPRISANVGRWRPFIHGMAGVRHLNSNGTIYTPLTIDIGGGERRCDATRAGVDCAGAVANRGAHGDRARGRGAHLCRR